MSPELERPSSNYTKQAKKEKTFVIANYARVTVEIGFEKKNKAFEIGVTVESLTIYPLVHILIGVLN